MKRKSYKSITQLEETQDYLKALELSWSVWNWRGKNVEKDIEEWEWYEKNKEKFKHNNCPVCTLRAKTGVHYVCRSSLEMKDCSFVELCRACVHMWQHGTPELQKRFAEIAVDKIYDEILKFHKRENEPKEANRKLDDGVHFMEVEKDPELNKIKVTHEDIGGISKTREYIVPDDLQDDLQDYNVTITLPEGFQDAEIMMFAKVLYYNPARPAPHCKNPSNSFFSDAGDPEEFEYQLKGFLRFEPDKKNKAGDPEGLMIELTEAQLEKINEHFDLYPEILREYKKVRS